MHVSAVEGPTGEAVFKAGGDQSWHTETYKGWSVSLEWAKSGRKFPRVLVIWLDTPGLGAKQAFWTIAHTSIVEMLDFRNADDGGSPIATGKPSAFCFQEAQEALNLFGKTGDKAALFTLVDVVLRFGLMMARQPVAPMHVKRSLTGAPTWEMKAVDKNSGKTIDESSI